MPTAAQAADTLADRPESLLKNRRRKGVSRANDPVNTSGENDEEQSESPQVEAAEKKGRRAARDEELEYAGGVHYSESDTENIRKRAAARYGR